MLKIIRKWWFVEDYPIISGGDMTTFVILIIPETLLNEKNLFNLQVSSARIE